MARIELKSCQLRIKAKTGTLASGNDSTNTISFSGCNQNAEAEDLLAFADAIESLRTCPTIEIIRRDDNTVEE